MGSSIGLARHNLLQSVSDAVTNIEIDNNQSQLTDGTQGPVVQNLTYH